MTDNSNSLAAAALARKIASKECKAKFNEYDAATTEHRAALALTKDRLFLEELRAAWARQEITCAAWKATRRAWLVAVEAYCAADYVYCDARFEAVKIEIRMNDNAETRAAYGKAIRAKKAAVNRECKARRAAAAKF
jgi:hypothetical protein